MDMRWIRHGHGLVMTRISYLDSFFPEKSNSDSNREDVLAQLREIRSPRLSFLKIDSITSGFGRSEIRKLAGGNYSNWLFAADDDFGSDRKDQSNRAKHLCFALSTWINF